MSYHLKKFITIITFEVLIVIALIIPQPVHATQPKMVFASYMQGFPTYGNTVEDFKKEINEAKALGIDGFIYYAQSWNIGSNPKIFTAADQTGFKIIVSPDFFTNDTTTAAEVIDFIKTATQHSSYYKYNNRPIVMTWKGDSKPKSYWVDEIINPLKHEGINILFLPYFVIESQTKAIENWNWPDWFTTYADGFNLTAASRGPANSVIFGEQISAYMKSLNKLYMANVSPYYFRTRHSTDVRDYIEYNGGEGIAKQWESLIKIQKPQFINITTWNDYTESYISPVDVTDPTIFPICGIFCLQTKPLVKSHIGYAKLMKYFITWYKTGNQPVATEDSLFYFYRTHPKNLVASGEPNDIVTHGESIGPDPDRHHNNISDTIFITTILKEPATLTVSSGGRITTSSIEAGMHHIRIPFLPGRQIFKISRNNTLILMQEGGKILSQITLYNFVPTTGFISTSRTPKTGDLNSDNLVNQADVTLLISKYGNPYTIYDYNTIVANWNQ